MFTLLLLSASPQGLTALVPPAPYHRDIAQCSADTTSLIPPLCWHGSSSSACYPMDFYFRPVCQVTHLFSWKPFLKTLGSRSLPGLSCHSFTDFSEHFHCLGIHRNNTSKPTETSIHQPRFNLMICWAKTFPTQCHAGFKRWAISHQQFVAMVNCCCYSKKLYLSYLQKSSSFSFHWFRCCSQGGQKVP